MRNATLSHELDSPPVQPTRRRWRCRIACVIVIALLLLLLFLPSLIPQRFLKERIVNQMQRDLGRKVTIGAISLSWLTGVQVEDIEIQRRKDFQVGPFLRVRRFTCPFNPWSLLNNEFGTVSITEGDLYVVVDADGRANLDDVIAAPRADTPKIQRFEISDFTIHLLSALPDASSQCGMLIERASFARDVESETTQWSFSARQLGVDNAVIKSQGCFDRNATPPVDQLTAQQGFINISNVDLGASDLASWLKSLTHQPDHPRQAGINILEGRCSAKLTIKTTPADLLQLSGTLELDDITLTTKSAETWLRQADISAHLQATYDVAQQSLQISSLDLQTAGLTARADAQWVPNVQDGQLFTCSLSAGQFEPAPFIQAFPALAARLSLTDENVLHDGLLRFQLAASCTPIQDRLDVTLDADEYSLLSPRLVKHPGEPAQFECSLLLDRRLHRVTCDVNRLYWPHLNGDANAVLEIPDAFPTVFAGQDYIGAWQQLTHLTGFGHRSANLTGVLHIDDVNALADHLPDLISATPGVQLAGPLDVTIAGAMPAGALAVHVVLPSNSSLVISDPHVPDAAPVFVKRPDQSLSLNIQAVSEYPRSSLKDVMLEIFLDSALAGIGPGRVTLRSAQLAPASAVASLASQHTAQSPLLGALNQFIPSQRSWESFSLETPFAVKQLHTFLQAFPTSRQFMSEHSLSLEDDCRGTFSIREDREHCLGEVSVDLHDLGITLLSSSSVPSHPRSTGEAFIKPSGQLCKFSLSLDHQRDDGRTEYEASLRLKSLSADFRGTRQLTVTAPVDTVSVEDRQFHLRLAVSDLAQFQPLLPGLYDTNGLEFGPVVLSQPSGRLDLNATVSQVGSEIAADLDLTADDTAFVLTCTAADHSVDDREPLWRKGPNTTLRLTTKLNARMTGTDDIPALDMPWQFELAPLHLQLADSSLDITGTARFDRFSPSVASTSPRAILDSLSHAQFHLQTVRKHDDFLSREAPLLQTIAEDCGFGGSARLDIDALWDRVRREWYVISQVDLSETDIHAVIPYGVTPPQPTLRHQLHIEKPLGDPFTLDVHLRGALAPSAASNTLLPSAVEVQECQLRLPGLTAQCSGVLAFDASSLLASRLSIDVGCDDLSLPAAWLPALSHGQLQGHYRQRCEFLWPDHSPETAFDILQGLRSALLDVDAAGVLAGTPCSLVVEQANLTGRELWAPRLAVRLGENDLALSARVEDMSAADPSLQRDLVARAEILAGHIDLDDVNAFIERLGLPVHEAEQAPSAAPADPCSIADLLGVLRRIRLDAELDIDELQLTDAANQARLDMRACDGSISLQQGQCAIDFNAALSGGLVSIQLSSDLNVSDPLFHQEFSATDLQATESLKPLVETEFPDLEVLGTITEYRHTQALLSRLITDPDAWSGTGNTILHRGVLHGPGGPAWLLRVMPNLKSVVFPWNYMYNDFELLDGAGKRNQLVFDGDLWNIYIDGVSTPVKDDQSYQQAIESLYRDRIAALDQVARMEAAAATADASVLARMRRRAIGLGKLIAAHEAGYHLRVTAANYRVGLLVGPTLRPLSALPDRRLLRVPAFYTTGYIVGSFMVNVTTSSVSPAIPLPLSRLGYSL